MYDQFGAKELYEVAFKATDNMRIFNQNFEKDEVIMYFDKIQISNINTSIDRREATGGKGDFSFLSWENVSGMQFQFEDGLVSKNGFNLLTKSTMKEFQTPIIGVPKREFLISDGTGRIELKYNVDTTRPMFIYKTESGIITEKILNKTIDSNIVTIDNNYQPVIIDYYFLNNEMTMFEIGGERIKGFLKMTSKIESVDEKDGSRKTILFSMPKIQVLSNINLTFGIKANPIVSTFVVKAFPESDGKTIARFFFLNEDIEG